MAGMSVDGLVSGLDTTSLISQLVQAEAAPQAQLKTKLSTTTASATAYRAVNSRFDAVRAAAEALTKPETWSAAKATSSSPTVTASVGTSPQPGTLTFAVTQTAAVHSVHSDTTWKATDATGLGPRLEVYDAAGASAGFIDITGTTVADAVTAINKSSFGLSAAAVKVGTDAYRLQVTATASGAGKKFDLAGDFSVSTTGRDAKLTVGTVTTYDVVSPTNTFTDLLPGTSFTVSKADTATPVTVDVTADPQAVAGKVKALVDAVNNALSGVKTYTAADGGPTAVLKGDSGLSVLASSLRSAVSFGVGDDGSPNRTGIQLTKDGTVAFDQARFVAALQADPGLARRIVDGTPAAGATAAVPGVAGRVLDLATKATDTTTGTLTMLAKGRDALAKDIQTRIDAWDLRLAQRKQTLTRQFTAMETALSAMKNQSNWLAGQISSLPSSS